LAEKIAEKEGKLTNATETAGTARIFRLHAEVAGGGFSVHGELSKGEGSEMRGGEGRLGRGRSPLETEARGERSGERGEWLGRLAVRNRERGEREEAVGGRRSC